MGRLGFFGKGEELLGVIPFTGISNMENELHLLIKGLKDINLDIRRQAAESIFDLGDQAEPALDDLLQSLNDSDPEVRYFSIAALGQIAFKAEKAIPKLYEILLDSREQEPIRCLAANCLGRIGPGSLPFLKRASEHSNDFVRLEAVNSFCTMAMFPEKADEAVEILVERLGDRNADIRLVAVEALERYEALAAEKTRNALAHENSLVKVNACLVLAKIGTEDKRTVKLLLEESKNANPDVKAIVAELIPTTNLDKGIIVQILIDFLEDESRKLRDASMNELRKLGSASKSALPLLIKNLKDEDFEIRAQAALTLGSIGVADQEAITTLITLLGDENNDVVLNSLYALGQMGPQAIKVAPKIRKLLSSPLFEEQARIALKKISK
jgi:HEAT repeat protein